MKYTRYFEVIVEAELQDDLPNEDTIMNLIDSITHHFWDIKSVKDTKRGD